MKKILAFACFLSVALFVQAQELVAILAGDTLDPTIGTSVVSDLRNMKALLTDAAMNAGMGFRYVELSGSGLTKDAIAAQVRNIPFGPNDTVFFYYSGHGYRTESKAARWPNFGFRNGKETLDSVWVNETLKKRNPRLLISLSDCCNVTFEDIYAPRDPAKRAGGDIKAGYREFFLKSQGVIVISSSIPGQPSQGYENGGAFSLQFIEAIKNGVKDKEPSWSKVLISASRRIDFGDGLVQDPQFDQFDAKGTLLADEKGIKGSAMATVPVKPEPVAVPPPTAEATKPDSGALSVAASTDASKGSWTILFYVMADCDLEGIMLKNAAEAAKAFGGTGVNAVFYVDRSDGWSNASLGSVPDWIGAKYLAAKNGDFTVLETKGRVNSGDSAVLSDFISSSLRRFPAERYAVFFADHGFGWNGYGGDESFKSDILSLAEITAGLKAGLERSGGVKKFDMVAFDACLMGAYEIARGLAPYASWLLASEEYVPGHGFDYSSLKSFSNPGFSTARLLSDFVSAFKKKVEATGTSAQATLSAIDLGKTDDLARSLKAFADALTSNRKTVMLSASRQRTELMEFGKGPSEAESLLSVDLGTFLGRAATAWPHAKKEAEAALAALKDAVQANYAGPARLFSTGLSVYYPTSRSLYDAKYDALPGGSEWRAALSSLLSTSSGTGPMLVQSAGKAVYAYDSSSRRPFVGANLKPERAADVSSAWLDYGIVVGEGFIMLGKQKAKFTSDRVGSFFDGKAAMITQGSAVSYAYSIIERSESSIETTIPFKLYREGQAPVSVRMVSVTDVQSGKTSASFWASNASGTVAQVEPDGKSRLRVLALAQKRGQTRADRKWFELKDEFLFSPDVALSFAPIAESERLRLEISVKDAAGSEDWAAWTEP